MAGQRKHKYPSDAVCARRNKKDGYVQVAKELGIPAPTYMNHCRANDIPTAKEAVAPTGKAPDTSQEVSVEEVLRDRVKELESQARKDRKNHVWDERVAQAVERNIDRLTPQYKHQKPKVKKGRKAHEFALLLSDLHAGETVSLEETGGINSYNWEIMNARMGKLAESLISYQDHRPYPVETLNLWMLGDMLSGNIHAELEATNEIPLAEATVQLGFDLAEWVAPLKEHFKEIKISGVVGNHPRAHKKPWAKQGYDNADWTAYHIMARALGKHAGITCDIPKASQHRVRVAKNFHALLFHGDGIRSSMPGVPWGGVSRRVQSLSAQYQSVGQNIDLYCLGHFHTANYVQTNAGRIAMNGAVKGVDEYSIKAFGGGAAPQQMLLTWHEQNGPTDCSIIDL